MNGAVGRCNIIEDKVKRENEAQEERRERRRRSERSSGEM